MGSGVGRGIGVGVKGSFFFGERVRGTDFESVW